MVKHGIFKEHCPISAKTPYQLCTVHESEYLFLVYYVVNEYVQELFPFEREIEAYKCTPIFYAHSRFMVGTIR